MYSQNFPWSAAHSLDSAPSIAKRCKALSGKCLYSSLTTSPYFCKIGLTTPACADLQAGHWISEYTWTITEPDGLPAGGLLDACGTSFEQAASNTADKHKTI